MIRESRPVRLGLRTLVVVYLALLVLVPIVMVVINTFSGGLTNLATAFSSPAVTTALRLTGIVTFWSVVLNLVFGVGISLLLVRYDFAGKRLLSALVDLPLSVSPVVVGLALMLVYRRDAPVGSFLYSIGYQIIFATPGLVLATVFVAFPLVVREIVPVLTELGDEQEQAARSLGGNGWQVFWRITLPSIKWAVVYGIVLALARSLGEFGAVKVVSGNIALRTQTATLVVEETYGNFQEGTAYAVAFLLTAAAVACITFVSVVRPKEARS
ncbi:sulfate ABC transporter permease subunit [Brooklawnia sp.]|uniref:sulfate ABC transporter permease n=1 Tax=Brooklawnia sp. TaxID=2699740 RepID=UPI00311DD571